MPLRDHFRGPAYLAAPWEALHGGWPMVIVQHLRRHLPPGFVSEPRVHAGSSIEVDVAAFERDGAPPEPEPTDSGGGVATAVWAPPAPTVAVETTAPDEDAFEVRVYDVERGRALVAAVEIVSPANKDRPEKRNAFVGKCAALLKAGVSVTIVDVVTERHANLYAELLAFLGLPERVFGPAPPAMYAAACRWLKTDDRAVLQTWPRALAVGRPLPTLPLWLTAARVVPLDLEASYQRACEDLSIP